MKFTLALLSVLTMCFFSIKNTAAQSVQSRIEGYAVQGISNNSSPLSTQKISLRNIKSISSKMDFIFSKITPFQVNIHSNSFSKNTNLKSMYTQDHNQRNHLSRRLKYSSLWAFTSLNYLYADLVGLMDVNLLSQYQTGIVNGIEVSPAFLTTAAAYMQIPLSNVFLPHVIKNDKALRWVQIISGTIATLAQGASLFVGEPSPYYILFSAIEIGVTSYITIDAIKWKVGQTKSPKVKGF